MSRNDFTIAFIPGRPVVIREIPYIADMPGIRKFDDRPEYYCALQLEAVLRLTPAETICLRNDLEAILSKAVGVEMELGFAEIVSRNNNTEFAVMCYFKERGVPQCQQSQLNTDGKTML